MSLVPLPPPYPTSIYIHFICFHFIRYNFPLRLLYTNKNLQKQRSLKTLGYYLKKVMPLE
jgi:hypothetical protein